MREILFRGKQMDGGEWISGDLRHWRNGQVGIHNDALRCTQVVIPETVGQYTGLKDMNGRRIFEGDIVCYDNSPYNVYCEPQTGVVAWKNGSLCFKHTKYNSTFFRALCSDDFFSAKCEVIGNVHETRSF